MGLKNKNKRSAVCYKISLNFMHCLSKLKRTEYDHDQHNEYIAKKEMVKKYKFYQNEKHSKQVIEQIKRSKKEVTYKIDSRIIDSCKEKLSIIPKRILEVNKNYQLFYNDKKVGLDLIFEEDEIVDIHVFKTSYYNTYITNRHGPVLRYSNQIGVQLLCITSDGKLIIPRQGFNNSVHRGKCIATASGSMDWADYQKNNNLKLAIEYAMLREFSEENSIENRELRFSMKFLGMLLTEKMTFKPDFFAVAYLDMKAYELKCSRDETFNREEYDVVKDIKRNASYFDFSLVDAHEIDKVLSQFLLADNAAEELQATLMAFSTWLKSDEDKVVAMQSKTITKKNKHIIIK